MSGTSGGVDVPPDRSGDELYGQTVAPPASLSTTAAWAVGGGMVLKLD
jgi:hypothetical protein